VLSAENLRQVRISGARVVELQAVGQCDFLSECAETARQAQRVDCADGLNRTRRRGVARVSGRPA
jgi:hypothetical protein